MGRMIVLWILLTLLVSACTLVPVQTARVVTPTLPPSTPSEMPEAVAPTSTPTLTPAPTATATTYPTIDTAALSATSDAALAHLETLAGGARLVCVRHEDTDVDGQPEWVAVTHQPDAVPARLHAFVLDGEQVYPLPAAQPQPGTGDVGLGQYPHCEVVIRDVNVDGTPEIAIFGHADGHETLMHLFSWDSNHYRRLGFFSGDAGVKFMDVDGDLAEEIWEGYVVHGAPNLGWFIVHTWEDGTYGWTSEHYDWVFADRPQTYPTGTAEHAVIAFYLALDDRDLPGAYDLLWPDSRLPYAEWALGYATMLQVSVGGVHRIPAASGEERAQVAAMVTAWDNEGGVIVARLWNVEWDTVRSGEGWRLLSASTEKLEEWPVPYWP